MIKRDVFGGNEMTFNDLQEIIIKNNIPQNAVIKSNSGWECGATDIGAFYYSPSKNEIHLVQDAYGLEYEYDEDTLMSENDKAHDWIYFRS
jgi:hypothetical protein